MVEIEIEKLVSGPEVFRAAIRGEAVTAEEGATSSEALGELVRRHPERFGVSHVDVFSHYGQKEPIGSR